MQERLEVHNPFIDSAGNILNNRLYYPENDCVYLKPRSSVSLARDSVFIPNIKPGELKVTHKGNFSHDSLIGRQVRDIVKTHTGTLDPIPYILSPTQEPFLRL